MSTLENQPPESHESDLPAQPAGIFLEVSPDIPKPPENFAPGFLNLGAFRLFSEDRRLELEEFQEVFFHSGRYSPEDVRQWVTPDNHHVYVFIKIGAETKTQKRKQTEIARSLGALAHQ